MIAAARVAIAVSLIAALPAMAASDRRVLEFADLDGWSEDDHAAALAVFQQSCDVLDQSDWSEACFAARKVSDRPDAARQFFETWFQPVQIGIGSEPLFTGYYEPELDGSPVRTDTFRWPIYQRPPEIPSGKAWLTRREIEEKSVLDGRGLEIAWLPDPVDVFFLQVQGSGRIRLPGGKSIRVGFGGRNGHPYRSVGKELARRGIFEPHQVSSGTIRRWVRRNPDEGQRLLWHNPSFIFFREVDVAADLGPEGALGVPLTPLRSVAVDRDHIPLGAPVWLEKEGKLPLRRLMIAQDTGSAVKGPQRADVFVGSGPEAGRRAGRMRDRGRILVLMPRPGGPRTDG